MTDRQHCTAKAVQLCTHNSDNWTSDGESAAWHPTGGTAVHAQQRQQDPDRELAAGHFPSSAAQTHLRQYAIPSTSLYFAQSDLHAYQDYANIATPKKCIPQFPIRTQQISQNNAVPMRTPQYALRVPQGLQLHETISSGFLNSVLPAFEKARRNQSKLPLRKRRQKEGRCYCAGGAIGNCVFRACTHFAITTDVREMTSVW